MDFRLGLLNSRSCHDGDHMCRGEVDDDSHSKVLPWKRKR